MYAMIVVSEIAPARWSEAEAMLKSTLAPRIQQSPGFVSGTWARSPEGGKGRSMVLFETEEAARAVADMVSLDPAMSRNFYTWIRVSDFGTS